MKNNKKKGFTLVELLVVIAIIAILAAVSVVGYTAFIAKANQSNADNEAKQVEQAIEAELMAGDDYIIDTVQSTETVAVDTTKTTYFVKASDRKIYTSVIKCEAIDDAATEANEEKWSAATETAITTDAEIDKVLKKVPDFAGLKGTFALTNGVLTYTYEKAVATIDFN